MLLGRTLLIIGKTAIIKHSVRRGTDEEEFRAQREEDCQVQRKVQQQLYRINSSIVAKTAKNKKKAEKEEGSVAEAQRERHGGLQGAGGSSPSQTSRS